MLCSIDSYCLPYITFISRGDFSSYCRVLQAAVTQQMNDAISTDAVHELN